MSDELMRVDITMLICQMYPTIWGKLVEEKGRKGSKK